MYYNKRVSHNFPIVRYDCCYIIPSIKSDIIDKRDSISRYKKVSKHIQFYKNIFRLNIWEK